MFEKKSRFTIKATPQSLALKHVFRISRGEKTHADVIVVTFSDGIHTGWAEAVPYARYKESVSSVLKQIKLLANQLAEESFDPKEIDNLISALPAGAARNALDCAYWDLKAKQNQQSINELLSLPKPHSCITAQTLSIDTPEAMAKAVSKLNNPELVKVKLDNHDILEKMQAIAKTAPNSKFIIDANEGWKFHDLQACARQLKALNVVLIEQPLPAQEDQQLVQYQSPIPLCADESCHTRKDLNDLFNKYQVINIKLDKTGGLTEAVKLAQEAEEKGFGLMIGCMVGSSLAMAPATLLMNKAQFVDLDGPLLICEDRPHGLKFHNSIIEPVSPALWGGPDTIEIASTFAI